MFDRASSYEETRAELARMMSALNAKALRSRTKPTDNPSASAPQDTPTDTTGQSSPTSGGGGQPDTSSDVDRLEVSALLDVLTPRQAIPMPPEEPPQPDATPPEPDAPPTDTSAGHERSRLLAAFDALNGPVLSQSARSEGPAGETSEQLDFRTEFGTGDGLPSRKPRKSWAEIQSAAVVESPADGLFGAGTPVAGGRAARASLGAAFGGGGEDTSAELRAALGESGGEAPATFGEWSASGGAGGTAAAAEPADRTADVDLEPSGPGLPPSGSVVEPSGDGRGPSGASVGVEAAATYDEPLGPQRRPEGLPRRGERSATTIASLLTEALAAYQSTTDELGEQQPAPERVDSVAGDPTTNPGRHRSPE